MNDEHENSCGIQNIVYIPYGALYRLGIQITSSHKALTVYLMGTLRVLYYVEVISSLPVCLLPVL